MSQLEKLLDERWPLSSVDSANIITIETSRRLFTEGYIAGHNSNVSLIKSLGAALSYAGDTGQINYDLLEEACNIKKL